MSEFMYGKEKYIEEGEQIIFENNTDSSFGVETGIIFHKSGLYDVDINNNHVVVSKVDERKGVGMAEEEGDGMSKTIEAMIISFCFGLALAKGTKSQDILLIITSIVGMITNLINVLQT